MPNHNASNSAIEMWGLARLIVALLLGMSSRAATLTIIPITPFGETIDSCTLRSFSKFDQSTNQTVDYKGVFTGMRGDRLDLGNYKVSIVCGRRETRKEIALTHSTQIELLCPRDRLLIAEHNKPVLSVTMKQATSEAENWWIRMHGEYSGIDYVEPFVGVPPHANIIEPESGSYVVTMQSTGGYSCIKEIDLMEQTRQWSFDAAACSLVTDKFARPVQPGEKRNPRQGPWFEEMRRERERLFRALEEAAGKENWRR